MEGWRAILLEGFEETQEKADTAIAALRSRLAGSMKKLQCVKCGAEVLEGDLVAFNCNEDCTHRHCFDCLEDVFERQQGQLDRMLTLQTRNAYPMVDNIVLCTMCLTPVVLHKSRGFVNGFQQKQSSSGRLQYKLLHHLTTAVRAQAEVLDHYENQRRSPFGKFKSRLLPTDGRSLFSTKDGNPVNRSSQDQLNEGEVWLLTGWSVDRQSGDPQGWHYAFNWPDTGIPRWGTWGNAPSGTTFVRRRRMLRCKIKLIDELKVAEHKNPDASPTLAEASPMVPSVCFKQDGAKVAAGSFGNGSSLDRTQILLQPVPEGLPRSADQTQSAVPAASSHGSADDLGPRPELDKPLLQEDG